MNRHAWIDEQLAAVPLFEGLSKRQLGRISSLMTRIDRPAGQVLTTEGHAGSEFFIVLEGELEVRQGDRVIATRGPGEYAFGRVEPFNHLALRFVLACTPVKLS